MLGDELTDEQLARTVRDLYGLQDVHDRERERVDPAIQYREPANLDEHDEPTDERQRDRRQVEDPFSRSTLARSAEAG